MILITGANGHFGRLTIDFLIQKGVRPSQISAMVRSAEKAADLQSKGVTIVLGDYNNYASLLEAFRGIEKLFFISGTDLTNRTSQHERVVKAAKEAGVKHVIYTSGEFNVDSPDSPLWLFAEAHIKTEQWLKESELTYTILKNGLYMEYLPYFIGNVLETETIYLPAGNGKVSVALRSEMAEATAAVLASRGHENQVYHLVNTAAYGYQDVANYLSEITGKPIRYISPTESEFKETLKKLGGRFPEEFIGIVLAQAQGEADNTSEDLANLIGREPTRLKPFLEMIYNG